MGSRAIIREMGLHGEALHGVIWRAGLPKTMGVAHAGHD